ncbi:uncharacterized protein BJ212DRAFT_1487011 [Suillus subaureus]|uniref:Uncharacterized protein n=1 Tax=Suillus subaureus TaxID=48587 RepID=A0A9P7DU95_9AGAM|nr:uncharacterized protein BJ212DRAFT_1487011 [Suillus subaureus]KAG1803410.1 hypothetical protein BJ212DRAFT_1487011 [Suillus subaureus]
MAASSKPADESSHSYNALPNDQGFDSMISDTKFTADTRTDFYDRSLTSRRYALVGMACSSIFSCSCIVAGIVTLATHGVPGVTVTKLSVHNDNNQLPLQGEILALALNFIVMLCTESIGLVHSISLRSALASESRLRFNTNLRLLTAARGWHNLMAPCLMVSRLSSSLYPTARPHSSYASTTEPTPQWLAPPDNFIAFAGLPLIVLGVALLLQVVIALSGMRAVKILTWSSSPFDLTAALVHHTQLTPATLRCMRCVSDLDTNGGPVKPPEIQPSAWHAHPSIRKVVIFLWVIVAACAGWATLMMYIWHNSPGDDSMSPYALTAHTWSFIPDLKHGKVNYVTYTMPGINLEAWILMFGNMAIVQGPLTLGLHCSELIANVIRDERQWRCATSRKGLSTATNPVTTIFTHPICLILFVAKPFLHWMFGLSLQIYTDAAYGKLGIFCYDILTLVQIWNLCIALFIFACLFTFVTLRRPRGPQPAAYGHLQTLANLVDEWSPVMWWGHKEDGIPYCHAGTSDHPLPDVKMDCVYAGSGAGSLVPLS